MTTGKNETSTRANRVIFRLSSIPSELNIPDFIQKKDGSPSIMEVKPEFVAHPDHAALQSWVRDLNNCNVLDSVSVIATEQEQENKNWKTLKNIVVDKKQTFQDIVNKRPTKNAQLLLDMFHTERDNLLYPLASSLSFYMGNEQLLNINQLLNHPNFSTDKLTAWPFDHQCFTDIIEAIQDQFTDLTNLEIKQVTTRHKDGVFLPVSITSWDFPELNNFKLMNRLANIEKELKKLHLLLSIKESSANTIISIQQQKVFALQEELHSLNEQKTAIDTTLDTYQSAIDNYRPKPVLDFLIWIFGLTLLGFKTYAEEHRRIVELHRQEGVPLLDLERQIAEKDSLVADSTQKIEMAIQSVSEIRSRIAALEQEKSSLEPQTHDDEQSAQRLVETTLSTTLHAMLPTDTPAQEERPSRPQFNPLLAEIQSGKQLKKRESQAPLPTTPPVGLKQSPLSQQLVAQISANSQKLKTSYMLLSIQNIPHDSTKIQLTKEFNEFFRSHLKELSAMIVDNEVRLPITNEISITLFSQWCASQSARFKPKHISVAPVADKSSSSMKKKIVDRRPAISSDSDNDSDAEYDSDDESNKKPSSTTVSSALSQSVTDAFDNRLPYLQTSLKTTAQKKVASSKQKRPSAPAVLPEMKIVIPTDHISTSSSVIRQKLDELGLDYTVGSDPSGEWFKLTAANIVAFDQSKLIDELSRLNLPKTVSVIPYMPFGTAYKNRVTELENEKKRSTVASETPVSVINNNVPREPEPRAFLKIKTGLETPCVEIESFFREHEISFQQQNDSYYLDASQAESLARVSSMFIGVIQSQKLNALTLSYLCDLSSITNESTSLAVETDDANKNYVVKADILTAINQMNARDTTQNKKNSLLQMMASAQGNTPKLVSFESLFGDNIAEFDKNISKALSDMKRALIQQKMRGGTASTAEEEKTASAANLNSKTGRASAVKTFFSTPSSNERYHNELIMFFKENEIDVVSLPADKINNGFLMRCGIQPKNLISSLPDDIKTMIVSGNANKYEQIRAEKFLFDDALINKLSDIVLDSNTLNLKA